MAQQTMPNLNTLVYSDAMPLLPTHPGLNDPELATLETFSPWEWRKYNWNLAPPRCPECGLPFTRPNDSKMTTKSRTFCTSGCSKRWENRLDYRYLPTSYRNKSWPGKEDNEYPPDLPEDIQIIKTLWAKDRDKKARQPLNACEAKCRGFPTNSFPLQPDRRGEPCRLPAGWNTAHPGTGRCKIHDTTSSSKSAVRQKAMQMMQEQQFILGGPINISPEEAILQEVHRTAGHVQWLFQKIQQVGEQSEDDAIKQFTKLGVTPSVWMDLYQKERQHLMNVAATAARMGIAERQVKIAEEQGRMLASVIQRFLDHPSIALTPLQRVNAPEVIRELLATATAPELQHHNPQVVNSETGLYVDTEIVDAEEVQDQPSDPTAS